MSDTVVVTGGTGFIGANVVRQLLARGYRVKCIVRKARLPLEGLDVELVKVPLDDAPETIEQLARTFDGVRHVYHVAGLFDPSPGGTERMHQIHVQATRGICTAAVQAGVERVLVCSSSVTVGFGPRGAPGDEDATLDPTAIYGPRGALRDYHDSKLESERIALSWPGLETVVVNPDFIIGAWDIKPTSGQMIVTMAQRRWVPVYPKGGKCFQDADDCALGHILAVERGTPGRRYLLGNENLSYLQFMTLVAEVVGARPPRIPLPGTALRLAGLVGRIGSRFDEHRFAGLDPTVLRSMQQERYRSGRRAIEELGVPQTSMRTAIEKAYRWFRDHDYC